MAAPLLIPLVVLSGATIALAASSSKKKAGAAGASPGIAKTYMLDANLPPALSAQVLAALSTSNDPFALDSFAAAIGGSYPYAAAALRYKAATERALQGTPAPLVAPPMPGASPTPSPSVAPAPPPHAPSPPPVPDAPVADWQKQILLLPEPTRTQVLQAMMGQNDPNALEAFAKQLDAQYPTAAWALRVREAALRGTPIPQSPLPPDLPPVHPPQGRVDPTPPVPVVVPTAPPAPLPSPPPQPVPAAVIVPPPSPAPVPVMPPSLPIPVPAPLPAMSGLDPNMPVEMQKAVAGALTTETDPAKLEGFASAIQAQYPVAAGLLSAKAQALRLAQQLPHGLPVPPPPPPPPSPVKPAVAPAPAPAPNSGRPAFPASGTYVVASGDSPWAITAKFTGHGERWKELISANPDKPTRADGAWQTLMPGEVVKLPQSWNNTATSTALAVKSPALLGAPNAHA